MLNHTLLADKLSAGLQTLQLNLSPAVQRQLLDYIFLLEKWNQVYNLTAIREPAQMIPHHLLDSLAVAPHLKGRRLLDVGTGGGIPGLVLAISHPEQDWTLLDKSAKKIRFVQQVIATLRLKNAEAVCNNIQQFRSVTVFDTVISRAYTRLSHFYQQTLRLHSPCLLAMKGTYPTEELVEMQKFPVAIECLPLQVPQLQAQRHLVIIQPLANS